MSKIKVIVTTGFSEAVYPQKDKAEQAGTTLKLYVGTSFITVTLQSNSVVKCVPDDDPPPP